jgi:GDPmannose 4,6-dehydratase
MWMIMQADTPSDYVVATGETHSVREFCEIAFRHAGLPIRWRGKGLGEQGVGPEGRVLIEIDPRYFRPAEVDVLLEDSSKIRSELGWRPTISFAQLVHMMVEADINEHPVKE